MAGNPKYQYADMDKLRETQKEALEDFASRVSDFAKGTAKEYAAPFANTAGMLLSGAGKKENSVTLPAWNSSGKYKGVDRQALHEAQIQAANDYAQAMKNAADTWKKSGSDNIDHAKQGLGPFGRVAVDVGVQSMKMAGDKALGAMTKIGATPYLALRTFGDAAQTARQEGATLGQQALYGVGSAISGAMIEKAFDGVAGVYGAGKFDEKIKKAVDMIAEEKGLSEWQRANLQNKLTALAESLENSFTNAANSSLKSLYNGRDSLENLFSTDLEDIGIGALRDFIIALFLKEK